MIKKLEHCLLVFDDSCEKIIRQKKLWNLRLPEHTKNFIAFLRNIIYLFRISGRVRLTSKKPTSSCSSHHAIENKLITLASGWKKLNSYEIVITEQLWNHTDIFWLTYIQEPASANEVFLTIQRQVLPYLIYPRAWYGDESTKWTRKTSLRWNIGSPKRPRTTTKKYSACVTLKRSSFCANVQRILWTVSLPKLKLIPFEKQLNIFCKKSKGDEKKEGRQLPQPLD